MAHEPFLGSGLTSPLAPLIRTYAQLFWLHTVHVLTDQDEIVKCVFEPSILDEMCKNSQSLAIP